MTPNCEVCKVIGYKCSRCAHVECEAERARLDPDYKPVSYNEMRARVKAMTFGERYAPLRHKTINGIRYGKSAMQEEYAKAWRNEIMTDYDALELHTIANAAANFESIEAGLELGKSWAEVAPAGTSREEFETERTRRHMTKAVAAYGFDGQWVKQMIDIIAPIMGMQIAALYRTIDQIANPTVTIKAADRQLPPVSFLGVNPPDATEPRKRPRESLYELNRANQGRNNNFLLDRMPSSTTNETMIVVAIKVEHSTQTEVVLSAIGDVDRQYRVRSPLELKLGDKVRVMQNGEVEREKEIFGYVKTERTPCNGFGKVEIAEPGRAEKVLQSMNVKVELPPLQVIKIEGKIDLGGTCDCGAEKCKTTHADWCSTRATVTKV